MRLDEVILLYFLLICFTATLSAVLERDVLKLIVKSSLQSLSLVMALVVFQAPELVLVYLPISVGAYTILFVDALRRTPRHETRGEPARSFKLASSTLFALIAALIALSVIVYDVTGGSPSEEIKELGKRYLQIAYNETARDWWSGENKVVVSILWDYRGVDTLFEITVLTVAILAGVASFRFLKLKSGKEREVELSVLSKISVKIVSAITIVVAIALLLSDHLPGGGFQSGVTLAIAPAILMAAFSGLYFRRLGFKEWRLAAGLTLGVLGLALVALAPIALGGAALQNQAKPWLEFGGFRIDFFFVSIDKSIKIYDVLEAVVTASGFSLAFLLLLAPEEVYSGIRRRLRWSPGRV